MTIENTRKELTELIDNIKLHSDRLSDFQSLPLLELEVILSKITKLQEKAIILRYVLELDQTIAPEKTSEPDEVDTRAVIAEDTDEAEEQEKAEIVAGETENETQEEEAETIIEETEVEEEEVEIKSVATTEEYEPREEEEIEEQKETQAWVENKDVKQEEKETPAYTPPQLEDMFDTAKLKKEVVQKEEPNFFDEVLEKEENPISLDEIVSKEEMEASPDINERFSENMDASVGNRLQKQPIQDLLAAIGLNERYLYANDLFDGEMGQFKEAVQKLNDSGSFTEAEHYFNELSEKYGWKKDNDLANALLQLVRRRHQ